MEPIQILFSSNNYLLLHDWHELLLTLLLQLLQLLQGDELRLLLLGLRSLRRRLHQRAIGLLDKSGAAVDEADGLLLLLLLLWGGRAGRGSAGLLCGGVRGWWRARGHDHQVAVLTGVDGLGLLGRAPAPISAGASYFAAGSGQQGEWRRGGIILQTPDLFKLVITMNY